MPMLSPLERAAVARNFLASGLSAYAYANKIGMCYQTLNKWVEKLDQYEQGIGRLPTKPMDPSDFGLSHHTSTPEPAAHPTLEDRIAQLETCVEQLTDKLSELGS